MSLIDRQTHPRCNRVSDQLCLFTNGGSLKYKLAMSESEKDILLPGDIEVYVKYIEPTNIQDLGSPLWFESHHRLEKLSQQAAVEALGEAKEESVKDLIISYNKVPILIHEAICIQVWREKVFRQITRLKGQNLQNTFIGYVILYHEITAVSLLQNILYHKDSVQGIDDAALDLIDYCAGEIVRLLSQVRAIPDLIPSSYGTIRREKVLSCYRAQKNRRFFRPTKPISKNYNFKAGL